MVLIWKFRALKEIPKSLFPSPCGDYGSYQNVTMERYFLGNRSFRPLAGIMVLIIFAVASITASTITSFRPLAGIMVLIKEVNRMIEFVEECSFRPLAGIMVLI